MSRALVVFTVALLAALLASMSGGSASAITTPAWLALGVPPPLAVATDKLQGALWTLLGARNYLRSRLVDARLLAVVLVVGLAGAWAGARLTLGLDPARLRPVVGGIILVLMAVMLFRPRIGARTGPPSVSRGLMASAALPLGMYEGMLGSGNGIVTTLLFSTGRGMDLAGALGHYFVLAFAWCGLAALVYASHGVFDAALALPAAAGGCLGGYAGSRLAAARRPAALRAVFLGTGTLLGLYLLLTS